MTEAFLHYIWQYQFFSKEELKTSEGEVIIVCSPGLGNVHAGPDFLNARVRIGELEWRGNIEIHINSNGWIDHRHQENPVYENVVLHVVWKEQSPLYRNDGSRMPTLELCGRVSTSMLDQYKRLLNSPTSIPCSGLIHQVPDVYRRSAMDASLLDRLMIKARAVLDAYEKTQGDWEEATYRTIGRNLGFKINADPMESLTIATPFKVLMRHSDKLHQVEAILFGQSGLLDSVADPDDYTALLSREYALLAQKFGLANKKMSAANWHFLRMRPANFPTIRIAQFASLVASSKNLFSVILDLDKLHDVLSLLTISPSAYWSKHYLFGKPSTARKATMGVQSVHNLVINSVVPILFAYGKLHDEQQYLDRAVRFLEGIEPERNSIMNKWSDISIRPETAADSQALIQLYNRSCVRRKCLQCSIGVSLLKP